VTLTFLDPTRVAVPGMINAGFGLEIQKVAQNVPEVIATMDAFVKKLLMPFFVQITFVVLVFLSKRTILSECL
jgi:hypothetical protein